MDLEYGNNVKKMEQYLRNYFKEHELSQSLAALDFAMKMHHGQTRNEGIPYIVHPMTMACHALSLGILEDDLIAVILLHDVCEDCNVEPGQLPVNENIRQWVDYMTFQQMPGEDKEAALQRYYLRMRESREACLLKLFDRCHNVSSMSVAFSDRKIYIYIDETKKYIYPLFEYVRNTYQEYTQVLFVLEYHITSVLDAFSRSDNIMDFGREGKG